jgi:hypothetical protein
MMRGKAKIKSSINKHWKIKFIIIFFSSLSSFFCFRKTLMCACNWNDEERRRKKMDYNLLFIDLTDILDFQNSTIMCLLIFFARITVPRLCMFGNQLVSILYRIKEVKGLTIEVLLIWFYISINWLKCRYYGEDLIVWRRCSLIKES